MEFIQVIIKYLHTYSDKVKTWGELPVEVLLLLFQVLSTCGILHVLVFSLLLFFEVRKFAPFVNSTVNDIEAISCILGAISSISFINASIPQPMDELTIVFYSINYDYSPLHILHHLHCLSQNLQQNSTPCHSQLLHNPVT